MNEHELATLVVDWARLNIPRHRELEWLHSNGNGASYGPDPRFAAIQNHRRKQEGMVPGICDLFLPCARRGFHGYFLELKAPGKMNEVRDGQREFMAFVESEGYLANVFDDYDDVVNSLEWYLSDQGYFVWVNATPITADAVGSWDASIKLDEADQVGR